MITYKNIQIDGTKGNGGIGKDPKEQDAAKKLAKYEADVLDELKTIERQMIGTFVIGWIANSGRTLTIQPSYGGLCPDGTTADTPEDAYSSDDYVLAQNTETGKISKSSHKGTGKGSDVEAFFTAENFKLNAQGWNQCFGGKYGSQPDEALFHELVHALRQMFGQYYPLPTTGSLMDYDDEEEFYSVVATNVYISSKNRNDQLRANHHGHDPLPTDLNTSAKFVDDPDNRKLLVKQCDASWVFWFAFADVPAKFNPFQELRKRYIERSL